MSHLIIIRRRAETHVEDAYKWYEKQRAGLRNEFLFSLEAIFSAISKRPQIFQLKHKNIRCGLVPRFPYGIFILLIIPKLL